MEAYLDNAATTQAFDEVCREVEKVMMIDFGNPSSKHTKGMQAENYINEAKENIAATLKCQPKEIIFLSILSEEYPLPKSSMSTLKPYFCNV